MTEQEAEEEDEKYRSMTYRFAVGKYRQGHTYMRADI